MSVIALRYQEAAGSTPAPDIPYILNRIKKIFLFMFFYNERHSESAMTDKYMLKKNKIDFDAQVFKSRPLYFYIFTVGTKSSIQKKSVSYFFESSLVTFNSKMTGRIPSVQHAIIVFLSFIHPSKIPSVKSPPVKNDTMYG
jgi:hypothetical protein